MPKVSTLVYMLDRKIWKLFRPSLQLLQAETGEKGQNVISSSVQQPISLIFAIHVSFIIPLPMMWILLTKPMQKSVTTVCLHCSFSRLKNKHIGVLGTNVATISWLHLRSSSQFNLVSTCVSTLSYGHRSFRKASADLWNKLPQHIKYCQTINQFKTSLKTHLFTMAFDD